jgi:hypothetical protein
MARWMPETLSLAMWMGSARQPSLDLDAPVENAMSQGATEYPINKVLAKLIAEYGPSKIEFIQTLDHDVNRGLQRLNSLDTGEGSRRLVQQIAAVYPAHAEELHKAVEETAQLKKSLPRPYRVSAEAVLEIEARERRRFIPFIWVHTEDGAHSMATAYREREVKVFWFKDGFVNLSETEKLAAVRERIREHYQNTGGRYIGFGAIQRYSFADTFDHSIVFDTAGNVIQKDGGRFLLPEVWWELYS